MAMKVTMNDAKGIYDLIQTIMNSLPEGQKRSYETETMGDIEASIQIGAVGVVREKAEGAEREEKIVGVALGDDYEWFVQREGKYPVWVADAYEERFGKDSDLLRCCHSLLIYNYGVYPDHRGHGLGRDVLRDLIHSHLARLQETDGRTQYLYVIASVHADNKASEHVLEGLGFVRGERDLGGRGCDEPIYEWSRWYDTNGEG